jgi:hypothetical protein
VGQQPDDGADAHDREAKGWADLQYRGAESDERDGAPGPRQFGSLPGQPWSRLLIVGWRPGRRFVVALAMAHRDATLE